jgi:RNA polymerase sigma-70 factor (ECF subfamily)
MKIPVNDPDAPFVKSFQDHHDRKSFEVLFDKYQDGIFNYCCRYLGDEDEAADCTQEIFIRVFRHIGSFRFKSLFYTWLFRIAVNNCHSYASALKKRQMANNSGNIDSVRESSADPEKALSGKEAVEAFHSALARLNDVQRCVIILRDMEGKSYEEIACISKMKQGTVKSTLARARYKMAEYLNIYKNGM